MIKDINYLDAKGFNEMNDEKLGMLLLQAFRNFKRTTFHTGMNRCLTEGQAGLLYIIYHHSPEPDKGITVSELSAISKQTSSNITQHLNGLEKEGVILRTIDPVDRRMIRVQITPDGLKQIEQHHKELMKYANDLIEHIGPEKMKEFIQVLEEITRYREETTKSC